MATVERSTNTPIRSIGYEFNKPVSSSDFNEGQTILLDNMVKYLGEVPAANSFKMIIDRYSGNNTKCTISNFRYLITDSSMVTYYGGEVLTTPINLSYPNTPSSGSTYDLYAYYKEVELTPSSNVYANGIRANSNQSGLVETKTTNNILDSNLNQEVSNRKALEFTFVLLTSGTTKKTISGWSDANKIATLRFTSSTSFVLETTDNNKPYIDKRFDDLGKFVSDGKSSVASAITGMGQTTASDATFSTMATNISKISPTMSVNGKTVTAKINGKNEKSASVADGSIGNISMSGPTKNTSTGKYVVSASQTTTTGYVIGTTKTNSTSMNEATVVNNTTLPSGSTSTDITAGKYIKFSAGYNSSDKYYRAPASSEGSGATVTANSPTISITSVSYNSGTGKYEGSNTGTTSVSVNTEGYISSSKGTKNKGTATAKVSLNPASIGSITMSGPTKNTGTGKYDVSASQTNTAGYYGGGNKSNSLAINAATTSKSDGTASATGGTASTSVIGMKTTSTNTGFSVSASATGGSSSVTASSVSISAGYSPNAISASTSAKSATGQSASDTKYIQKATVSATNGTASATKGTASTSVTGMETTTTNTGFSVSASATGGSASATGGSASVTEGYTTGTSASGQKASATGDSASDTKYIIAGSVNTDTTVPSGVTPTGLSYGKKVKVTKGYHNTDKYYSVPNQSDGTKAVVTASSPSISITDVSYNRDTGKYEGFNTAETSVSVNTEGYISSSAGTKNRGTASATVTLNEYKASDTSFNVTFSKNKFHVQGAADTGGGYASPANSTLLIDSDYNVSNTDLASLVGRHTSVALATCPAAFTKNATAQFDGEKYIYVGGGSNTNNKLYRYSIVENTWTTFSSTGISDHYYNVSKMIGQNLFSFGYNVNDPNLPIDVLSFNTSSVIKTTLQKYIPKGAEQSTCASNYYKGNLLFAGSRISTYRNYVWYFNFVSQTWTTNDIGNYHSGLMSCFINSGENRSTLYVIKESSYGGARVCAIGDNGLIIEGDLNSNPNNTDSIIKDYGHPIFGQSFIIDDGGMLYAYCLGPQYINNIRVINLSDKTETTIKARTEHYPYLSAACVAKGDIYYFGGSSNDTGATKMIVQRVLDKI